MEGKPSSCLRVGALFTALEGSAVIPFFIGAKSLLFRWPGSGIKEVGGMPRKRMTMPKRKDDIQKIVREVEEHHHHEHEHHHHHHHEHGDLEDAIAAMELLIDSLSAKVKGLEAGVKRQGVALAALYRVVAYLVEAVATDDREAREKALRKALDSLEKVSGAS